jgi:hypothetical protein
MAEVKILDPPALTEHPEREARFRILELEFTKLKKRVEDFEKYVLSHK